MRRAALWFARLDPTSAELLLAGSAIGFGLALLVPIDLATRSPAFRMLSEIMPQSAWATLWIVLGFLQGFGASTGIGRRQADVAVACLWSVWAVIQVVAMGLTIGPFSYGWLAVCSIVASHLQRRHGSD